MIKDLELPDLGEGIDGAEISEIPVSVGDEITKDQTILITGGAQGLVFLYQKSFPPSVQMSSSQIKIDKPQI